MEKGFRPVVPGFKANGIHAGIKEGGGKDLSLIYSQAPAVACAVFTTNDFKAAPVKLSMERMNQGIVQAIIANSGNANAATGEPGYRDAVAMSRGVAQALGVDEKGVLVASTGKIGASLPIERIVQNVPALVSGLAPDRIVEAEEGIMTTDRFPKIEFRQARIGSSGSKEISMCGIAKGAGMIEPNLATMLTFLMTDAVIERGILEEIFREAVERSFNAISVDGCMSTNDTAIILANGYAGNEAIAAGTSDYAIFKEMLFEITDGLARAMVRDGEGATKVMEILVSEARTVDEARKAAFAVARSNLVKTAFFGMDPNWGRIISAIGSIGISAPPDRTEVYLEDVPVFRGGQGEKGLPEELSAIMKREHIRVIIKLGSGTEAFRVYASDLSYEYVRINAEYHT